MKKFQEKTPKKVLVAALPGGTCGQCGRPLAKATRVHLGSRYCATCYKRWFVAKDCVQCGEITRAHRHDSEPVCKECQRRLRTCLRCNRLVPKAGLVLDGKAVCPSCAPYFKDPKPCPQCGHISIHLARDYSLGFDEPVCERCRREAHETCSICRKHRKVHQRDQEGRAVCKACAEGKNATHACPQCGGETVGPEHALCDDCQIRRRLDKRFRLHLERLETFEGRGLFEEFFRWFSQRQVSPRACGDLDRYAVFFETLDKEGFRLGNALSGAELIRVFSADQMRKATIPMLFFHESRGVAVREDELEEASEKRRIEVILALSKSTGHESVIKEFAGYLQGREPALSSKTVRVYLRTALSLLEALECDQITKISQTLVQRTLGKRPGLRASSTAFFSFLWERYGVALKAQKPKRTPAGKTERSLLSLLRPVLGRLEEEAVSPSEQRALTAFAISRLYGIPLNKTLGLKRGQLHLDNPAVLEMDGDLIRLDLRVSKYLAALADSNGDPEAWLFEGRLPTRSLSVAAVNYWVKNVQGNL